MKTHHFRFNPNLLAVELPNGNEEISVGLHCIGIKPVPNGREANDTNGYFHIYTEMFHGYELLGKLTDLTEDNAREFVKEKFTISKSGGVCGGYENTHGKITTALESLMSGIESEIYWENPHGKEDPTKSYFLDDNGSFLRHEKKQWNAAQLRTFDKQRTIIFKKV